MMENKAETKYTAEDIDTLEEMRGTLKGVYEDAVKNYKKYTDGNYNIRANQRTAIATSAQAWIEATDRLRQIKPG